MGNCACQKSAAKAPQKADTEGGTLKREDTPVLCCVEEKEASEVQGLSSSGEEEKEEKEEEEEKKIGNETEEKEVRIETPKWIHRGREERNVDFEGSKKTVVAVLNAKGTIETTVNGLRLLTDDDFGAMYTVMLDKETSPHEPWKLVYDKQGVKAWKRPPPVSPHINHGMKTKSQLCQVLVHTRLAVPPLVAYNVLHDSSYRATWDKNMASGRLVEKLSHREEVCYYATKLPMPLSGRDFCTIRGWRELRNGCFIIINHSVEHPAAPEMPGFVRGVSIGSGYLIAPIDGNPGECRLCMLSHSDLLMPLPDFIVNNVVSTVIASGLPKLVSAMNEYTTPAGAPWRSPPLDLYSFTEVAKKLAALNSSEVQCRRLLQNTALNTCPSFTPLVREDDTAFSYTSTELSYTHTAVVQSLYTDTSPPTP